MSSSSANTYRNSARCRSGSTSRSSPAKRQTTSREVLYGKFRRGEIKQLILSKVGNFAIDLPDAHVLVQVSGTFGSRQEEAQRLGRILRPKASGEQAHFFTLVTRDTKELDFSHHRQMFLTEQGYTYSIVDGNDVVAGCA
ncbi:MAG: helicase-related protein [Gemmataceae bacterium]